MIWISSQGTVARFVVETLRYLTVISLAWPSGQRPKPVKSFVDDIAPEKTFSFIHYLEMFDAEPHEVTSSYQKMASYKRSMPRVKCDDCIDQIAFDVEHRSDQE